MERVDTLVIGASFFGIGYAVSAKEKCLIVESESIFGTDFVAALKANPCDTKKQYSAKTSAFLEDAIGRNAILDNGRTHICAMSTLLTKIAHDENCDIILNTSVTSIESKDERYIITLLNSQGFTEIEASRIIDTRVPRSIEGYNCQKLLCGMLVGDSELSEFENDEVRVQKGVFDDEFIFAVKLSANDAWETSREKFHTAFAKYRKTVLANCRVASVATSFAYEFASPVSENSGNTELHISASYHDYAEAFEGGTLCATAR